MTVKRAVNLLRAACLLHTVSLLMLLSSGSHAVERLTHNQTDTPRYQYSTVLMTTDVEFIVISADQKAAQQAVAEAIAEFERIEALLSEWKPDSEISRLNRLAAQAPQVVSDETFRLLEESLAISRLTSGKFDITFKSAGKLWDFHRAEIPDAAQLQQAASAIDYRRVELDPATHSVRFTSAGTQIGLGGIAKGYAVDRAVQIIRRHGFAEFAVNAGGDLYAVSHGNQKMWQVGVRHPRAADQLLALLPVANAAVTTSGDYERFFDLNGVRYHHILDPATGQPARGSMSVTVLAPRTYLADALATGVFVLGPQAGMALIESLPGVEAMIVDSQGEIHVSAGLSDLQRAPAPGR